MPAAFRVQFGSPDVPNTGTILTAPANFSAVGSLNSAIAIPLTNHSYTAGNRPKTTSNHVPRDFAGAVSFTAIDTLNLLRVSPGTTAAQALPWALWEYIGAAGGPNEFIVRSRHILTLAAGTRSVTATIPSVANIDKVVPFITGVLHDGSGSNATVGLTAIAYGSGTDTLNVVRGGSTGTTTVYVSCVEFTGSNWTVLHARSALTLDQNGTLTLRAAADGQSGAAASVGNWANAWIIHQFKNYNDDDVVGPNTMGKIYRPGADTQTVNWTGYAAGVAATQQHVVHVLVNSNMPVTRYQNTTSSWTDWFNQSIASAALTDLSQSLLFVSGAANTAAGFPRGLNGVRFSTLTTAQIYGGRDSISSGHDREIQVVRLPEDTAGGVTGTFDAAPLIWSGDLTAGVGGAFTAGAVAWSGEVTAGLIGNFAGASLAWSGEASAGLVGNFDGASLSWAGDSAAGVGGLFDAAAVAWSGEVSAGVGGIFAADQVLWSADLTGSIGGNIAGTFAPAAIAWSGDVSAGVGGVFAPDAVDWSGEVTAGLTGNFAADQVVWSGASGGVAGGGAVGAFASAAVLWSAELTGLVQTPPVIDADRAILVSSVSRAIVINPLDNSLLIN